MKKLMMVAAATVAAWCSWGAESISVDKVANHYPWDGKVDCVVTLGGTEASCEYKGVFTLSVEKSGETVRRVVTNDLGKVAGTYTNTFDCTELFGAGYYPNGGISVALVKELGGVQLWADGPYFAECNVGATKPEEYGYYFWWGDTVGYKRNSADDGWVSSKDVTTEFSFSSGNCPTYNKTVDQLTSAGYTDSTRNLVAAHDAATAHLGAPWRMPTDVEIAKLANTSYCTRTWTINWKGTGVAGYVVTGVQSGYTDKSIFLPAAGNGYNSGLSDTGSRGCYWCSTASLSNSYEAWGLYFDSFKFGWDKFSYRSDGQSVRPIRSAE